MRGVYEKIFEKRCADSCDSSSSCGGRLSVPSRSDTQAVPLQRGADDVYGQRVPVSGRSHTFCGLQAAAGEEELTTFHANFSISYISY